MFQWLNLNSRLLLFSIIFCFTCSNTVVHRHANNGHELVSILCQEEFEKTIDEVYILLNSSVVYHVESENASCVLNASPRSLIVMTDGPQAKVLCRTNNSEPQSSTSNFSLAFLNMNVTIIDVRFFGCGSHLSSCDFNINNHINSSFVCLPNSMYAVLIFINCSVTMNNLLFNQSIGFFVVAIDLLPSRIENSIFTENSSGFITGLGILILYTRILTVPSLLTLFNCTFSSNFDFRNVSCIDESIYTYEVDHSCSLIKNSGVLTVIFHEVHLDPVDRPVVLVQQSLFIYNWGASNMGMVILMFNTTVGEVRITNGTEFSHSYIDTNLCPGMVLLFYMKVDQANELNGQEANVFTPFVLNNVTIKHLHWINEGQKPASLVYVNVVGASHINIDMWFRRVEFAFNVGRSSMINCLLVTVQGIDSLHVSHTRVFLESVILIENQLEDMNVFASNSGLLTFINVHHVYFNGSMNFPSYFHRNNGSVIMCHFSDIHLSGYVVFSSNRAKSGAALYIRDSLVIFDQDLFLKVINNFAYTYGGALFIWNSFSSILPLCAVQIEHSDSIDIILKGNRAIYSGDSIYGTPLYNCLMHGRKVNSTFRLNHSEIKDVSHLNEISSVPVDIKVCTNTSTLDDFGIFPGRTFQLSLAAIDFADNYVMSYARLAVVQKKYHRWMAATEVSIPAGQQNQVILESRNKSCTKFNVSVYYHSENCLDKINEILISLQSNSISTAVELHVRECPPLFALRDGVCNCSLAIEKFFDITTYQDDWQCDINTLSISLSPLKPNVWFGEVPRFNNGYGISIDCVFTICSRIINHSMLKFNLKSGTYSAVDPTNQSRVKPICRQHRTGVLCGECEVGYSVVFGSGICKQCSNWWLLTIVLYGIAGPLLIYLIFVLNLTLAQGTINGIVFYAQAANVGILTYLQYFSDVSPSVGHFLSIFLSLLNLNLGFPLCFYDGMDEMIKTGLSILFPIYLLVIVLCLIVFSHYSSWLANRTSHLSVQVLVTVVHLSISSLLSAVYVVANNAKIYIDVSSDVVSTETVWAYNGSVTYGHSSHVALAIFIISIAGSFVVPYMFLLITGRCLLQLRFGDKYCRAAFEAIHGPYKEKKKFWFTARLLLLVAMDIVILTVDNVLSDAFVTLLFIFFLFFQLVLMPFKSKFINISDSVILLNVILYCMIVWLEKSYTHNFDEVPVFYGFVVFLACSFLIHFILIIAYHVTQVPRIKAFLSPLIYTLYLKLNKAKPQVHEGSNEDTPVLFPSGSSASFYQSVHRFRESLLEYEDN